MLTRMPDMTRLLDRMEEAGLVTRERGDRDRRLVRTHITPRGLEILAELEEPVMAEHRRSLGHMTEDQLRMLVALLTLARGSG
jgi:DNA-binding MarR family transcriptional regulator